MTAFDSKKLNMRIISFLGLPASGKGTQAEFLAKKINAKILGTGDLIRDEIKYADTSDPFYNDMKQKYDKGLPQSDEVVIDIVKKNIDNQHKTLIFDNFPFSQKQAKLFFELCKNIGVSSPILIVVNISRDTANKRILSRKICTTCESVYIDDGNQICEKCGGALVSRSDDNKETLNKRIDEYIPRLKEVEAAFRDNGTILEVDGEQSIKAVSDSIFKGLRNAKLI